MRTLEWRQVAACYGLPFLPAFIFFFIDTADRGKVYGSAIVSLIQTCGIIFDFNRVTSCGAGSGRSGPIFDS